MEQEVKMSEVTIEMCNRLNDYRNFVKNDMMIGDTKIIEGIDLVEKLIREINPNTYEDDIKGKLLFLVNNYRKLKENKMQVINRYMQYGIDYSCILVEACIEEQKKKNGKIRVLVNN